MLKGPEYDGRERETWVGLVGSWLNSHCQYFLLTWWCITGGENDARQLKKLDGSAKMASKRLFQKLTVEYSWNEVKHSWILANPESFGSLCKTVVLREVRRLGSDEQNKMVGDSISYCMLRRL